MSLPSLAIRCLSVPRLAVLSFFAAATLIATEPRAQGFPDPATEGVWGTAYEDLAMGDPPSRVIETDGIACLTEPSVVTANDKGYRLTSYILDPEALAAGDAVYYRTFETICRFDQSSGIETCQDASGADPLPYYTYFEALDAAAGIYRGHALEGRAEVVQLKTEGKLPEETWPFVIFLCPSDLQPRPELLTNARDDQASVDVIYGIVDENIATCGLALCGGDVQRALELTR